MVVSRMACGVLALLAGCAAGGDSLSEGPDLLSSTGGSSAAAAADVTSGTAATLPSATAPTTSASSVTTATSGTAPDTQAASTATASGSTTEGCDDPATWYRDQDEDGFGDPRETTQACSAPNGYVDDMTDCNDGAADINPGVVDPCGGPDKNCDSVDPPLCRSCLAQLDSGNVDGDGLYTIDPDGAELPQPQLQVWCDMTTDGGGWTLVQRTVWDPAQTNAMRTGYQDWYNLTIGSASPGLGFRMAGHAWPEMNDQLDHLIRADLRKADDDESCAPLFYKGTGGVLTADATTASLAGLESDVPIISGPELSTTDTGPSAANCVGANNGVPWFYSNCCATCPGFGGTYWAQRRPMLSYSTTPDLLGNTEADVCSTPAQLSNNGLTYVGANSMEYYLR